MLAFVCWVAVPQARSLVSRAGAIRVATLVVPAALVNAWFLLPALAYGSRTAVFNGLGYGTAHSLHATKPLVSAHHLFTFSRAGAAPDTPDFVLALPILAIAWVLAGILLSLRDRRDCAWRRVLPVLAGSTALLAIVMTHPRLIVALPHPYRLIQCGT